MIEYRSFADLNRSIVRNLYKIPQDVDIIVGIPRSGIFTGSMIATYLNKPFIDLDNFLCGKAAYLEISQRLESQERITISGARRILIVDDSLYYGTTMDRVKQKMIATGLLHKILYCVVYVKPDSKGKVDISFEECPFPRLFQWNIMHHAILAEACMDIDGVLCVDPTPEQNDDGPLYERFVETCKPIYIPSGTIGYLVTCRLEKYRIRTENWLKQHNIKYNKLIMMNFPNKAARLASGSHASFKAKIYRETGASIFIESDLKQAIEIADKTCKQVFCVETQDMILPHVSTIIERIILKIPKALYRKCRSTLFKIKSLLLKRLWDA